MQTTMSSADQLSRIRHSLTTRRAQIVDEMSEKKIISKKQCLQWMDELYDIVITADTDTTATRVTNRQVIHYRPLDHTIATASTGQDKTPDEHTIADTTVPTDTIDLESQSNAMTWDEHEVEVYTDPKTDANNNLATDANTDHKTTPKPKPRIGKKIEPRYKAVIVGLDSLTSGYKDIDWDDWSTTTPATTSASINTDHWNDDYDDNWEPIDKTRRESTDDSEGTSGATSGATSGEHSWASGGQVLGGDTAQTPAPDMTAEQMRQLRALRTEQRLAESAHRGAHRGSRLTHTRPPGAPSDTYSHLLRQL